MSFTSQEILKHWWPASQNWYPLDPGLYPMKIISQLLGLSTFLPQSNHHVITIILN